MKLDAGLPSMPLKDVAAVAKAAEEVGFDALWTSETQHDPFLPCALIAEHTHRLNFGTAIAVSFARSPASLAYTAWDLAGQSGESAHRASLRHGMARVRHRQAARADPRRPRLLGRMAEPDEAELPRRALQADADVSVLRPGADLESARAH